jgi:hypothetical protein
MNQSKSELLNFSVKFYSWISESKSVVSDNWGDVLVFWIDTICDCKEENILAALLYIIKEFLKLLPKL